MGLDFSSVMLEALRNKFGGDPNVTILNHDLESPLPRMETFDAVISSFAIHHVNHERKRTLYEEIFAQLAPNGVFCNLEHVASPTANLHSQFLEALSTQNEDPSNKLLSLDVQLSWLRQFGFVDVDCHWKWRELALFSGTKPQTATG